MLVIGVVSVVAAVSFVAAIVNSSDDALPTGPRTDVLARGTTPGPLALQLGELEIEALDEVDLVVAVVTFAPGDATGWQLPAGSAFVIVKRGSLTRFSADDCDAQTHTSRHAFVQNDSNDRTMVRNEGAVNAEAIVTFVAPRAVAAHKRAATVNLARSRVNPDQRKEGL
jgi:hypothetical protein